MVKWESNEKTALTNYFEGLCWICSKNTYVMPTMMDVCADCVAKRDDDAVLAFISAQTHGFCRVHGDYIKPGYNALARLNVHICQKCNDKRKKDSSDLSKRGTLNSDPFYTRLRRTEGKDWQSQYMRRFNIDPLDDRFKNFKL